MRNRNQMKTPSRPAGVPAAFLLVASPACGQKEKSFSRNTAETTWTPTPKGGLLTARVKIRTP